MELHTHNLWFEGWLHLAVLQATPIHATEEGVLSDLSSRTSRHAQPVIRIPLKQLNLQEYKQYQFIYPILQSINLEFSSYTSVL